MSLTLGPTAPLGRPTGGSLNVALPDSPAHLLLHETRLLPRWCSPRVDVRTDLLESSGPTTHCPFKGDARYWHLRVGDRLVTDAFWDYPGPNPESAWLEGLLSQ